MELVQTSRNHSQVQLMISRILQYAKAQPATIVVTKNTTKSYHIDYIKDVLERNGFIVSLTEGHNHINVDISWQGDADTSEIQHLRAALEQFGWRLERTSCACGGEWAWLRRRESGAWEMYGCACHHLPATEPTGAERVSLCMECNSETHQTEHCHVCGSKHIIPAINAPETKQDDDLLGDWTDERCPKCGANLLGNKVGDKWCSMVGCDYGINAPEKVGTEEWRHKYFGAEWPKAEGDGNA